MKLALMRTATGKEDPELPLLQLPLLLCPLELPASEIAAQINASQSSSTRHISTSTDQRRLRESGFHGQIAANKPLLKDTSKKKRLAWANKHETQSRWMDDLCMSGSHCEAWRRWCGGALLVTLSVIHLEFKAHFTSVATTAFCSDTPSHLVCT